MRTFLSERLNAGLLIVVAMLMGSGQVFAAHPLVSEDNGTQGPGGKQIEVNSDWSRDSRRTTATAAMTFTQGVTDTLDLFLTLPSTWRAPAHEATGINDVSLGAKWRLLESDGFSLGVKPEWIAPTGDAQKGLGQGRDGLGLTVMGQLDAGDFSWLFNVGITQRRFSLPSARDNNRTTVQRISAALIYSINDRLKAAIDVGQSQAEEKAEKSHPKFLLIGAIYEITEGLDIDIGWKKALTANETDRQLGVGITWRFQ